jgi:DNA-directed RNA polymerase specialized sigma24 family protein
VGNGPDAEDCASAALEHALTTAAIDAPAAWLREVARRRAVDLVRRRVAERRAILRLATAAAEPDHAERVDDLDAARWLATQSRQLPPATRRVLERIQHGDSAASVAADLHMTKRSVESHVLRARRHLRAAWARSLSSIVALGAYLRRSLASPAVPPTNAALAAISATALLLGGTSSAPPAGRAAPPTPASGAISKPMAQSRNDTPTQSVEVTSRARHARAAPGMPTHTPQQVAAVKTAVASETVSKQHRPGPDDPVGQTLYCLNHTQVTTQHIGC